MIKPLTPEQLKRKHRSIPRNRFLAERLYYIKYIEHWGQGTNRVVDVMREEKLPDPVFEEISGGLNVTLIGPGKSFEKTIEDQKLHKLDLNERQKKAVEYLQTHNFIDRRTYVALNKVSTKTAYFELSDLVDKEILLKKGDGRSVIYSFKG